MLYDTRSQIMDRCIASANAGLAVVQKGIERYLQLGIPASKLVLGLPWYGYRYPCLNGTAPDAEFCPIAAVPFAGVNCSDAAGSEVEYGDIMALLDAGRNSTAVRWDESTSSPYFNAVGADDGVVYQYWFDSPRSIALKVQYARRVGLRGVGPFAFDQVDPTGVDTKNPLAPAETRAMWNALREFL